jgi:hypothetical protein
VACFGLRLVLRMRTGVLGVFISPMCSVHSADGEVGLLVDSAAKRGLIRGLIRGLSLGLLLGVSEGSERGLTLGLARGLILGLPVALMLPTRSVSLASVMTFSPPVATRVARSLASRREMSLSTAWWK